MMKKTIRTMSAIGVLAAALATFVTPLHQSQVSSMRRTTQRNRVVGTEKVGISTPR
ncbi:hypothetical protein OAQ34_06725 [Opitutales bacterium]|nr:hypothetical protein [Opitutales bacterium]